MYYRQYVYARQKEIKQRYKKNPFLTQQRWKFFPATDATDG